MVSTGGVCGVFEKNSKCMKKMERSLRKKLKKTEEMSPHLSGCSLAGVLCIGEEFLAFEQGDMRILLLNTALGKSHLEWLYEEEDVQKICGGRLEPDVAFLLTTCDFFESVGCKLLKETLFVADTKQEWQMQKHLCELVNAVEQEGNAEAGAILVRSCEKDFGGAGEWMVSATEAINLDYRKRNNMKNAKLHADLIWGDKIGEGAFSQVVRVQSEQTGEKYACKRSKNIAMLWREYCVGIDLEHPLFPKMYDFWQDGDYGYLLMEYVPGTDVKRMLERRKHFSVKQTIYVGMELAEGLLYLHEGKNPAVFRDIKPENIIIRQDGRVKLLDLGCVCSKDVPVNSRAGSPGFAAPEQFEEGRTLDETCDVYALARTMEEMLGTKAGASRKLRALLDMGTEKEVKRRIPDMRLFLNLLGELEASGGKPSGLFYKRGVLCHKNIWKRSTENS